jgi:hypothetical protein
VEKQKASFFMKFLVLGTAHSLVYRLLLRRISFLFLSLFGFFHLLLKDLTKNLIAGQALMSRPKVCRMQ